MPNENEDVLVELTARIELLSAEIEFLTKNVTKIQFTLKALIDRLCQDSDLMSEMIKIIKIFIKVSDNNKDK